MCVQCVCVCVCVRESTCARMLVHVPMCAHVCGGQKLMPGIFLNGLHHIFFQAESLTGDRAPRFSEALGHLAALAPLPNIEVTDRHQYT